MTARAAALLAGAALCGCAPRTVPPVPRPVAAAAVHAVLDDFHDAAAVGDFDRYFGHFAHDAVFLGTDASERWSVTDFKAYARPYFGPGGGWTYRPRDRHVSFVDPGTAFFDELLDNDALGLARGSGVLVREEGVWKVAQYNLSIPIPNEAAGRVVELLRRGGG